MTKPNLLLMIAESRIVILESRLTSNTNPKLLLPNVEFAMLISVLVNSVKRKVLCRKYTPSRTVLAICTVME